MDKREQAKRWVRENENAFIHENENSIAELAFLAGFSAGEVSATRRETLPEEDQGGQVTHPGPHL